MGFEGPACEEDMAREVFFSLGEGEGKRGGEGGTGRGSGWWGEKEKREGGKR